MRDKMSEQEAAKEWAQGEDVDLGPVPKRRMDTEAFEAVVAIADKYGFELEPFMAAVRELGEIAKDGEYSEGSCGQWEDTTLDFV